MTFEHQTPLFSKKSEEILAELLAATKKFNLEELPTYLIENAFFKKIEEIINDSTTFASDVKLQKLKKTLDEKKASGLLQSKLSGYIASAENILSGKIHYQEQADEDEASLKENDNDYYMYHYSDDDDFSANEAHDYTFNDTHENIVESFASVSLNKDSNLAIVSPNYNYSGNSSSLMFQKNLTPLETINNNKILKSQLNLLIQQLMQEYYWLLQAGKLLLQFDPLTRYGLIPYLTSSIDRYCQSLWSIIFALDPTVQKHEGNNLSSPMQQIIQDAADDTIIMPVTQKQIELTYSTKSNTNSNSFYGKLLSIKNTIETTVSEIFIKSEDIKIASEDIKFANEINLKKNLELIYNKITYSSTLMYPVFDLGSQLGKLLSGDSSLREKYSEYCTCLDYAKRDTLREFDLEKYTKIYGTLHKKPGNTSTGSSMG